MSRFLSTSLRGASLASILALAPAALFAAAPDWLVMEGNVLEIKLAHEDSNAIDGGILRIDPTQRTIGWKGIPGEFGCAEVLHAPFDEVKRLHIGLDAGFVLELRDKRKMTFLPLPHAAWFKKQFKVKGQGLGAGNVGEAFLGAANGGKGGDGGLGSGVTGASPTVTTERVDLPKEVAFDTRLAVDSVLEVMGRSPTPVATLREALYGNPVEISVPDLMGAPGSYEGRSVRLEGRLKILADEYRLEEDEASVPILPGSEIASTFGAVKNGEDLGVRGVFRRQGTTGREAVLFWAFENGATLQARNAGVGTDRIALETLFKDAGRLEGQTVRVVGKFRGRNLFGDLPAKSKRDPADWVIKDDRYAIWITGRKAESGDWKLDPESPGDTESWVEVVGKPRVREGVLYLRAATVAASAPPSPNARVVNPRRVIGAAQVLPSVVFSLPEDGEQDVARDTRIVVQFSKYMDEASFKGRVRLRYAGQAQSPDLDHLKLTYDDDRRALVIDPGTILEADRNLEVQLLPGVLDSDGKALKPRTGGTETFHFRIGRGFAAEVVSAPVVEAPPRTPAQQIEDARGLVAKGSATEAIRLLTDAIVRLREPDLPANRALRLDARLVLAGVYLTTNEPALARDQLKEVARAEAGYRVDPARYGAATAGVFEEVKKEANKDRPAVADNEKPVAPPPASRPPKKKGKSIGTIVAVVGVVGAGAAVASHHTTPPALGFTGPTPLQGNDKIDFLGSEPGPSSTIHLDAGQPLTVHLAVTYHVSGAVSLLVNDLYGFNQLGCLIGQSDSINLVADQPSAVTIAMRTGTNCPVLPYSVNALRFRMSPAACSGCSLSSMASVTYQVAR